MHQCSSFKKKEGAAPTSGVSLPLEGIALWWINARRAATSIISETSWQTTDARPQFFLTGYSEANLIVFSRLLTLFRRFLSLRGFPATFHAEFTQYLSCFPHLHANLPHFVAFLSLRYGCTFPTFHYTPTITIGIHVPHISLHFSPTRIHCFSHICHFVHYRILKSPRPSNTFRYRYTVIRLTPAKRASSDTDNPYDWYSA